MTNLHHQTRAILFDLDGTLTRLCSLDGLIDSAVFLEDTDVHKPHPEPILAALRLLSEPSRAAAYVGDSRHDIVAARAAGVRSVAALWGPAPRSELERERPDVIAESITDLLGIFTDGIVLKKDMTGCKE